MPSLLRQCDACQGKFATQYFRNSSACRLCYMQSKIERLHEKYEKCKKYDDLGRQFEVLKEFVSLNIGFSLSDAAPTIAPTPFQTHSHPRQVHSAAPPCA